MTTLAGGNALSTFRAQQLQPALEAIHPRISGIAARFVHLVATDAAPTPPELERLAALLTYGDPFILQPLLLWTLPLLFSLDGVWLAMFFTNMTLAMIFVIMWRRGNARRIPLSGGSIMGSH